MKTAPYRNVLWAGIWWIRTAKMSKSLGNAVDVFEMFRKVRCGCAEMVYALRVTGMDYHEI